MVKRIEKIMKGLIVFLFSIISFTNIICQNTNDVIVSSGSPSIIYPLINDKDIEERKKTGIYCSFIYPLLILNNVLINEQKNVNYFRNYFDRTKIKKVKLVSKEEAENLGIPNVPKDGVLFVTTIKGYYFDFLCD